MNYKYCDTAIFSIASAFLTFVNIVLLKEQCFVEHKARFSKLELVSPWTAYTDTFTILISIVYPKPGMTSCLALLKSQGRTRIGNKRQRSTIWDEVLLSFYAPRHQGWVLKQLLLAELVTADFLFPLFLCISGPRSAVAESNSYCYAQGLMLEGNLFSTFFPVACEQRLRRKFMSLKLPLCLWLLICGWLEMSPWIYIFREIQTDFAT